MRIRHPSKVSAPRPFIIAISSHLDSSLIDYIAISGSMERNVLEFVDHLHEHFVTPCSINKNGRYNVPLGATEGYRYVFSIIPLCFNLLTD